MPHFTLRPGERVIRIVRKHPAAVGFTMFWEFLLLFMAFFFMSPLLSFGRVGAVIFVALVFIALFLLFRTWLLWHSNQFMVTDRRVVDIDRRGFFVWVVSEAAFANIQDISFRTSGLVQTLLGAGDVVLQTASGFVNLELKFVHDPAGVRDAINEVRGVWKEIVV